MLSFPRKATLAMAAIFIAQGQLAYAQSQTKDQQKCINSMYKGYLKVAKGGSKNFVGCIKDFGKGTIGAITLAECIDFDRKFFVGNASLKTTASENKFCSDRPDFAYTSAQITNAQGAATTTALAHKLFGDDLAAVADVFQGKGIVSCQQSVFKSADKCVQQASKEGVKCAKTTLKDGAGDAATVSVCLGADSKGKVAKTCEDKLSAVITKKCGALGINDTLFPGCIGQNLDECIRDFAKQRASLALDAVGDLNIRILLYSRTVGFRHLSIVDAHAWLGNLDAAEGMSVAISEDASLFSDEGLAPYNVLLFANTTEDVLDDDQQSAMQRFIWAGGGYVGVHAAADTEHDWPWYAQLVGGLLTNHTLGIPTVEITNEDPDDSSTSHMAGVFNFADEIYNFDRNPRVDGHILLTMDEDTATWPTTNNMGDDHPIAWYKDFEGGRSWYTNLGHASATWADALFRTHLLAGIRWAANGQEYSRISVAPAGRNPMAMRVRPDGSVYIIERTGEVWLWNPSTGRSDLAALLTVDPTDENGLLGIALDPAFAVNGFVYLYYSAPLAVPPPAPGPPGENTLSRFATLPDGTLDLGTRTDLLVVPSERSCCHEGGDIEFGPDDTLFVSVGDNTNPFLQEGYAPLDDRPGMELSNSQRTASNPMDLRGKILRINPDGSIPSGNLFPMGIGGLPEIYAMGTRNPFTMAIDPATGRVYWGDVGPDANADGPRGPRGFDEINYADMPGDYGWPHCVGYNEPYAAYNYDTMAVGPFFDCTGKAPALVAYDYQTHDPLELMTNFLNLDSSNTGRTAIAGLVYNPLPASTLALPAPFADNFLMAEWSRHLIASVELDGGGGLQEVTRLMPWEEFLHPIDIEHGPDGTLYVLEYGAEYIGNNSDARLSRIEYSATSALTPIASFTASTDLGPAPLSVFFNASASTAPGKNDHITDYEWDFDGDGAVDGSGGSISHSYISNGVYPATLTVVGHSGRRSTPIVREIVVSDNTAPVVTITSPADLTTFPTGTMVTVDGSVSDPEDDPVPCTEYVWNRLLGHSGHAHPFFIGESGCSIMFDSTLPAHGDGTGTHYWVIELSYTDQGDGSGGPPVSGGDSIRINVSE
jgi:glucose/arabinose dehydrogenase/type 1 glutamine amidotransferase/PKD repeat protein